MGHLHAWTKPVLSPIVYALTSDKDRELFRRGIVQEHNREIMGKPVDEIIEGFMPEEYYPTYRKEVDMIVNREIPYDVDWRPRYVPSDPEAKRNAWMRLPTDLTDEELGRYLQESQNADKPTW